MQLCIQDSDMTICVHADQTDYWSADNDGDDDDDDDHIHSVLIGRLQFCTRR